MRLCWHYSSPPTLCVFRACSLYYCALPFLLKKKYIFICKNKDCCGRTGCHSLWKREFWGGFSGAEGWFSTPLKASRCRGACSTCEEPVPWSLCGTCRWEIAPAFPSIREAPARFPTWRDSSWETSTKHSPGPSLGAGFRLFLPPQIVPSASSTHTVGHLSQEGTF